MKWHLLPRFVMKKIIFPAQILMNWSITEIFKMAAKLKKRALAEYGSQVVVTSPEEEASSSIEPAKR